MTPGHDLRPSQPLYDLLAPTYMEHFEVPHRRLYDDLAWERLLGMLPPAAPTGEAGPLVVDAGCGVGRWSRRLLAHGYGVIGIEQAPGMLNELRRQPPGSAFRLIPRPMETVERDDLFEEGQAGAAAVLAMGSLQYTSDPDCTVGRLASWVMPGGILMVLVDSLVGLVLELIGAGRTDEALTRLRTRRGVWRVGEQEADLHLLDRDRVVAGFRRAGLVDVRASGLLVSAGALGRDGLISKASQDFPRLSAFEAELAEYPVLADAAKQLLVTGRQPSRPASPR